MKKCDYCGAENSDRAVFCEICGHGFPKTTDNEQSGDYDENESTENMSEKKSEKAVKNCPYCGGSGKADYLVAHGFKTFLEECSCHMCAGVGKVEEDVYQILDKQLKKLREEAVAGGVIRDDCPTCRGYGFAISRSKAFGSGILSQIKCPSCTGRKITYRKREKK